MQNADLPLFSQSHRGYPWQTGHKRAGASSDAAYLLDGSGAKNVWEQRCRDLFSLRPDWTAEEGINYYALKTREDIRKIDKGLRPRFSELAGVGWLILTGERRGENKIKPHVYRMAS